MVDHISTLYHRVVQRAWNQSLTLCCQPDEEGKRIQGTLIHQGADSERCQRQKRTIREDRENAFKLHIQRHPDI